MTESCNKDKEHFGSGGGAKTLTCLDNLTEGYYYVLGLIRLVGNYLSKLTRQVLTRYYKFSCFLHCWCMDRYTVSVLLLLLPSFVNGVYLQK